MKTKRYYAKYGAFSLPGKRPGCVLVIAMDEHRHQDGRDIHLLDEFESWNCRELVQRVFQLDEFNGPKEWIGDAQHVAVKEILYELNKNRRTGIYSRRKGIRPVTPRIIEDGHEKPYQYILDEIKKLRDIDHRQLYMDDGSLVLQYMGEIAPDEIAELKLGAYPAIEALAYAVIEMRKWERDEFEALMNPRRATVRNWNPLTGAEIRD